MSSSPAFHEINGAELLEMVNGELLGYAGSIPTQTLIGYLNQGKDALWAILKQANEKYFETFSQSTDATQLNYFATLVQGTREYSLPKDFREMKFIECVQPGYEETIFIARDQRHVDWAENRRSATANKGNPQCIEYHYDIIGNGTFTLAEFPSTALSITLWYIRALGDIDPGQVLDGVLMPFARDLAVFAAKRGTLGLQDLPLFDRWKTEWSEKLTLIAASAENRQTVDAQFVDDFLGE